jgi:hypothetical protein
VERSAREEVGRNPDRGLRGRTLEGENPREAPAGDGLNTRSRARDSREENPRNRDPSGRSGASAAGIPLGANGKWGDPSRNARMPSWRGNLRRVNPRSAAGVKENRHGSRGRSRQEGNQTLKAERSGPACPREVDLRSCNVLKGMKAHERSLSATARRARDRWVRLYRKVELEERVTSVTLNSSRPGPETEDHKAEETANGTVGTPNR